MTPAKKTATKAPAKPAAKGGAKTRAKAVAFDPTVTIPPHVDDELGQHWHRFKSTGEDDAREKLILHYAPLVKYVASRVATGLPASVEQADLVSYGMFGLIDALTKFEPGRGNKFETYAIPRIKGAIIDELRAMDWVPRSIRFKAREIEKAHTDLESMLKRQPTEQEMAERLGITRRELHDVVSQISFVSVLALDELVSVGADRGEQVSLIDTLADRGIDPTSGVESQETRGLLAAAINELSEREKIVVTLYYFEGLTLAEIGQILGVTESRVCQIHTKAVGGLRGQLTEVE
ncbi:MAG TPA: RNA polymerase sigma factor WhiG [Actinomycetota bacterium]|nr:RNA polymerase sigma factor WhiG [Actinomycetota bacterium]